MRCQMVCEEGEANETEEEASFLSEVVEQFDVE